MTDPFGGQQQQDGGEFVIDMADSTPRDDKPPWIMPTGWYDARVVNLTKKTSKNNNPMFEWEFKVKDDNIRYWTTLTTDALPFFDEVMSALGFEKKDGKYRFTRERAINCTCQVYIEPEEYNDKWYNRIVKFDPSGTNVTVQPPVDEDLPF